MRAWRRLPSELRAGHEIVFFSRRPDPLPIVHEAVAAGEARLLVRPSRADLIALYSMAEAFIFPSWIEGSRHPGARGHDLRRAADRLGSRGHPRGGSDAALLSDAEDDAALAQHMALVLGNPAAAQQLRERGYARAAQFSWRRTAEQILDSYERVVRDRPPRLVDRGATARG